MMRLDKFLSNAGIASRSEIKKILKKGAVRVNGNVVSDGKLQIDETADQVLYQGKKVEYETFVYYAFHKPAGCVCAARDALHPTVFNYVPMNAKQDLFTVGRLDLDTEGLLLITNDGALSHALLSPKKHVKKTYLAYLDAPADPADIRLFAEGIDIGEKRSTKPAELVIDQNDPTHVYITISEGMYHQVKRMVHACGKEVLYLKRLSMGEFSLEDTLDKGAYRTLTEKEMNYVREYKGSTL